MAGSALSPATGSLSAEGCDLDDLVAIVSEPTDPSAYPNAAAVVDGVVVYDNAELGRLVDDERLRRTVMEELAAVLLHGPGVVVFRAAFANDGIDRATEVFRRIIDQQNRAGSGGGDHFAKPGANDRVWNALEKLALADPEVFCHYYQNSILALVCQAWLGPAYQVTSQINVVNPGGEAQQPHRDYHLGFMTDDQAERFPAHSHRLSPLLTLQGAVAHCDMPVETGPTMYLPHSQKYEAGYLAWRRPDFVDYFAGNRIQLPLAKGDAIFFNPAVFHAAGTNRTESVKRMANLLQVSSAMGRAMEKIDRRAMANALFPVLRRWAADGRDPAAVARVIAASAEGYAFPADLDKEQPVDGLAPPSQAELVSLALDDGWRAERLDEALRLQSPHRTA